jgi:hypothetical protein
MLDSAENKNPHAAVGFIQQFKDTFNILHIWVKLMGFARSSFNFPNNVLDIEKNCLCRLWL